MQAREVAVLVPTLGTRDRASLLRRALESILSQEGVRAIPIVVLNGPGVEPELVDDLGRLPGIRLSVLSDASLPAALREGRRLVDTELLAALDDDDVLPPGALARRVAVLEARPECAAVVTNGICRSEHGDELHLRPDAGIEADPIRAMLVRNWLLPGSWLCLADAVSESVFAGMPPYLENTYLALVLASSVRIAFDLDGPTLIHHVDTPHSVSKSAEYKLGQAAALRRILELDLPVDVHREYARRLGIACASAAVLLARRGEPAAAFRHALCAVGTIARVTVRR